MTDTRTEAPSIADRIRAIDAGAPVVGVHFLGDTAAFVLGEEALLLASSDGETRRVVVHGGAILASAADTQRILTGGDDGKLMATGTKGTSETLATDSKCRWIDHVAVGHDGAFAWSAGKTAFVRTAKGEERSLEVPSTVGGLAFAPKGFRLAVAHYNGDGLWFPNAQAQPEKFEWKGSHLGVSFSPDGKFLVSSMQEPTLHGWRVTDRKDMRMSGYSARVRSMHWSADGRWLATSGSEQLILWPFQAKDGPMGKQPRIWGVYPERVSVVACHPRQPVVAVGYADGMILLVRIDDGAEVLARKPGAAPVSALGWNASGSILAFGAEDGAAGLIRL
jgi:WD40 repeat protein